MVMGNKIIFISETVLVSIDELNISILRQTIRNFYNNIKSVHGFSVCQCIIFNPLKTRNHKIGTLANSEGRMKCRIMRHFIRVCTVC